MNSLNFEILRPRNPNSVTLARSLSIMRTPIQSAQKSSSVALPSCSRVGSIGFLGFPSQSRTTSINQLTTREFKSAISDTVARLDYDLYFAAEAAASRLTCTNFEKSVVNRWILCCEARPIAVTTACTSPFATADSEDAVLDQIIC